MGQIGKRNLEGGKLEGYSNNRPMTPEQLDNWATAQPDFQDMIAQLRSEVGLTKELDE